MTQIIEAAFLTGFEPSSENLTDEALFIEAQEYLLNQLVFNKISNYYDTNSN